MFVIILKNSIENPIRSGSKCGEHQKAETQFPYKDDKTLIMLRSVVYTNMGLSFYAN